MSVYSVLFRIANSCQIPCLSGRPYKCLTICSRHRCITKEHTHMTALAKLNFKSVTCSTARDPILARRDKLVAGLKEQQLVHAAALKGEDHRIERHKWMNNEQGERVLVKTNRRVRPWFFEQDGGWYVQCRYGARVIAADGRNNAVFVKSLKDVGAVLDVFLSAAHAGELDSVLAKAAERKPRIKPGAAKAAQDGLIQHRSHTGTQ